MWSPSAPLTPSRIAAPCPLRHPHSAPSQELERTMLRDTLTFQMWAADSARTKAMIEDVQQRHASAEEAAAAREGRLTQQLELERTQGEASASHALEATAATLAGELSSAEGQLRMRAAQQALVVRLGMQHGAMHRCWKTWAVIASLLLREARSALLQLELSKQQQRGAHTRLQAVQKVEIAQLRVENLEARVLLQKSEILQELRPSHELLSDKQHVVHLRQQLQDARGSEGVGDTMSVAYHVGLEAMRREMQATESQMSRFAAMLTTQSSRHAEDSARALTEIEDRLMYEKGSSDFYASEQGRSAQALQRAGAEMRVLTKVIGGLELELVSLVRAGAIETPSDGRTTTGAIRGKPMQVGRGRPPLPKRVGPQRGRT